MLKNLSLNYPKHNSSLREEIDGHNYLVNIKTEIDKKIVYIINNHKAPESGIHTYVT